MAAGARAAAGGEHGYFKRDRIREYLLDLVETGEPGDPIPSERQLCAALDVSRPTLRAVVEELVRDGLLVKRHGQGMFIAQPKIAQDLAQSAPVRPGGAGDLGGLSGLGGLGGPGSSGGSGIAGVSGVSGVWSSRTVDFTRISAGARVGRRLRLAPSAAVLRVVRLRLVDGEPMSLDTLYLPEELVPGLTARDLETHSFYDLLESRYGIGVMSAVQTIEPTVTDEEEAALLGVPAHFPALLFERVTEDTDRRVVEFAHAVYRGDRYRVVSHLSLQRDRSRGRVLAGAWATAGGDGELPADPFFSEPGEPG